MTARILWTSILIGAAISLAASAAMAAQALTIGSVAGGWVYPYVRHLTMPVLVMVFVASGSAAALAWMLPRRGHAWLWLAVSMAAATVFQAAVRPLAPASLDAIVTSPGANAFYTVAEQHRPRDVLRRFSRIQSQAPLHVQSNMPGKILLVQGLRAVTTDARTLAWLLVGLSNAGALVMFLFVREVFGDDRTALLSAVLYLFVPARHFFLPLMNTITPVIILLCMWLLARWLNKRRAADAVLAGAALYALAIFEPLPLVMGLLVAGLALRAIAVKQITWPQFALHSAIVVLTVIVASIAVDQIFGFDLVSTFRRIAAHASQFNVDARRPYDVWITANLPEFGIGAGLSQMTAFSGALMVALRAGTTWRDRQTIPIAVVCLGLAAVLFVTDLIGINRGEVMRLWIFLACFFQIPTAYACATLDDRRALAVVVATSAISIVLGTAMIGFVMP